MKTAQETAGGHGLQGFQRRSLDLHGRVLIVDDDHAMRAILKAYLQAAGAEVTVAENGQAGYEQALAAWHAERPFDVILMDMQMPVLDGYGAASMLRRAGYARPIIAMTADTATNSRDRCLAAGCDKYHAKPIFRTDLLPLLAGFLRTGPRVDAGCGRG